MNPLSLYVLITAIGVPGEVGYRAYLFSDEAAARSEGERLQAHKPPEATVFEFSVVALEGAPE